MPRGFFSVRTNVSNPLHHLWRNNGACFWVHYTLHFGNRKRRIRRSLKTSDPSEAIRRRDELFARIEREGEEVPDRRPRRSEEEGEPCLDLVAYSPQRKGSLPTSKQHDHTLGEQCRFRDRLIQEADLLFADAKEAQARAEVIGRLNALWLQAGGLFRRAGQLYQAGSLGLIAKESHEQAAHCFRHAGEAEEATKCEQRAEIITTYYE